MSLVGFAMLTPGPIVVADREPRPMTAQQLTEVIERARKARIPRRKGTP